MTQPRLSHQECWELLPWHANATLAPDEAARVDEHLAGCAICREEIRACREMAVTLAGAPAAEDAGAGGSGAAEDWFEAGGEAAGEAGIEAGVEAGIEAGLARVMARIDAAEAAAPAGPDGRLRRRRWRALAATPRPVRWLLAAQAAALVAAIVAGTALRPAGSAADNGVPGARGETASGAFRTLSDPAPPGAAAGGARVRVVFTDGAAAAAVRDLLLAAGARVVDGPTPFGVYTVEPLAPGGETGASPRLLARLRADPAVIFAEPALAPLPAPPAEGAP